MRSRAQCTKACFGFSRSPTSLLLHCLPAPNLGGHAVPIFSLLGFSFSSPPRFLYRSVAEFGYKLICIVVVPDEPVLHKSLGSIGLQHIVLQDFASFKARKNRSMQWRIGKRVSVDPFCEPKYAAFALVMLHTIRSRIHVYQKAIHL